MKEADVNFDAIRQQRLLRENKGLIEGLQRANRMLYETREKLNKAEQARADFLGLMSHELRTPLNIITGFAELLLDGTPGKINEEQRQCLSDILSSSRHLLNFINDTLDRANMASGDTQPGSGDEKHNGTWRPAQDGG